jgi:CelD/BcsL family acetyltransferase involved in cellulose biosynthesis
MNIICIDPCTDPLWQKLINQYRSDAFHSPEWMKVLTATYGFTVRAYVILDNIGGPVAGIPFCRIEDIRGKRIVSLPFSDYCDPLVGEQSHWRPLVDKLLEEQVSVTVRPLHSDIALTDTRLTLVNKAKWHKIDLCPDLDTLWSGLHSSARRAIRKAQQSDIVVQPARDKKDLRAFFELHLDIRKYKYRLLAQPYLFLESIWDQFVEKDEGLLLLACHQHEVVGGIFFLEWRDGIYYKFNASASSHLNYRPNDLLIWNGIKYAKEKGFTYLDFGLSDWDQEGLVRYKRKFATEEKTISFLRYEPNGATSEQEKQLKRLLPQLTALFTEKTVPDGVTEKAGEVLYRFFS